MNLMNCIFHQLTRQTSYILLQGKNMTQHKQRNTVVKPGKLVYAPKLIAFHSPLLRAQRPRTIVPFALARALTCTHSPTSLRAAKPWPGQKLLFPPLSLSTYTRDRSLSGKSNQRKILASPSRARACFTLHGSDFGLTLQARTSAGPPG